MPNLTERFDHYAKDFFKEGYFEKDYDFFLKVEIKENHARYQILAEVPGIESVNIQLHLEDNCLIIEGDKYKTVGKVLFNECHYGHFYRWIPLGEDVDNDNIQAELSNGILKITLFKKNDGLKDYRKIKILKTTS